MRKNFIYMLLLASTVFTSCSNDYNDFVQPNELSPVYEEALKSNEFILYHKSYNQYMETMTEFVNQLSEEQRNTLLLLVEQCKNEPDKNQTLLEHYWVEIASDSHEKLEELHVNTISRLNAFNKKYEHLLSNKDRENLSETLLHRTSFKDTDGINIIKSRSVENNNDNVGGNPDDIGSGNASNGGPQSNQECVDRCESEYNSKKMSLAAEALCATAINVAACIISAGALTPEALCEQVITIASYAIGVDEAKKVRDKCIQDCD